MWKTLKNTYNIINVVGNTWQLYLLVVSLPATCIGIWAYLKHQSFYHLVIEVCLTIIVCSLIGILFLGWRETKRAAHKGDSKSERPNIEIITGSQSPYETSEIKANRPRKIINIGLKNLGNATAANCQLLIDNISPLPPGIAFPIIIKKDFIIRSDDPEQSIELVCYWEHLNQYRFSSSEYVAGFSNGQGWIHDNQERIIKLTLKATDYHRSAYFRLKIDEDKTLHLKFMNYDD